MTSTRSTQTALPKGFRFLEDDSTVYCDFCKKNLGTLHIRQISEHAAGKRHTKAAAISSTNGTMNNELGIFEMKKQEFQKNIEVDKDAFVKSILDGTLSNYASDEETGENSEEENGVLAKVSSDVRASGFTPLNYKPADGVDNFFDSMPEEAERTGISKDIHSILKNNSTPSKKPKAADFENSKAPSKLTLDTNPKQEETNVRPHTNEVEDNPNSMPPWVIGADAYHAIRHSNSSTLVLHYEILEFSRFMSPTKAETSARERVSATVTNIVKTLWPGCVLKFFGSYATGLTLPTSDIDVCITGSALEGKPFELEELARAVRNVKGFARKVHIIDAKVSLVKLVSRDGDVHCDICIGHENGPRNVPIICSFVQQYPALRPLLMVVKCFLSQRSLNEVYTGGLGSYAVLLLVVSHLQMLRYNFPNIEANLGAVLIEFFHLYGRMFNICVAGIAAKGDGSYYNKAQRYDTKANETIRISLEDPNDLDNNIGTNSFAVGRVRRAFANAYNHLRSWRRDDPYSPVTPLSRIIPDAQKMRGRRAHVIEDLEKRGITNLISFTESQVAGRQPLASSPPNRITGQTRNARSLSRSENGADYSSHQNYHSSAHRSTKRRRRNSYSSPHSYNEPVFSAQYVGPPGPQMYSRPQPYEHGGRATYHGRQSSSSNGTQRRHQNRRGRRRDS